MMNTTALLLPVELTFADIFDVLSRTYDVERVNPDGSGNYVINFKYLSDLVVCFNNDCEREYGTPAVYVEVNEIDSDILYYLKQMFGGQYVSSTPEESYY